MILACEFWLLHFKDQTQVTLIVTVELFIREHPVTLNKNY